MGEDWRGGWRGVLGGNLSVLETSFGPLVLPLVLLAIKQRPRRLVACEFAEDERLLLGVDRRRV